MCAPACISVTALRRACSFDSWYAPNGKSLISQATPCARRRPLATQSVWWRIVSSVTPTVLDKPWHTMPNARVRLSAGRQQMGDAIQALCFLAGANSIFYGDKLLTTGNPDTEADVSLMARLGMRAAAPQQH